MCSCEAALFCRGMLMVVRPSWCSAGWKLALTCATCALLYYYPTTTTGYAEQPFAQPPLCYERNPTIESPRLFCCPTTHFSKVVGVTIEGFWGQSAVHTQVDTA